MFILLGGELIEKKRGLFRNLWSKITENEQDEALNSAEEAITAQTSQLEVKAVEESQIYLFWKKWPDDEDMTFEEFEEVRLEPLNTPESIEYKDREEIAAFDRELELIARKVLKEHEPRKKYNPEGENNSSEEIELEEDINPVDAVIKIGLSKDRMTAFLFMFPPLYGGKEADKDKIKAALSEKKVIYGINMELIEAIAQEIPYYQIYPIARGLRPVKGKDGEVIDHYLREIKMEFQEDVNGVVDFKNLNMIQNVNKDDVICDIILPEPGVDGINVLGAIVPKISGKKPDIPNGKNTVVSEDGTKLLAGMEGHLFFDNNRFKVENVLMVKGNVDNSVGNVDFLGTVMVQGDVCNGFCVKAEGDVHVKGVVEGATIYATGNITIDKGMNGNKQGILNAQGDIKSKFLENCTVRAGGNIYADSIVWCEVSSDETVYVLSGKGVIIGSTIEAKTAVEAKMIGSKTNQKIQISLGYSAKRMDRKKELELELKKVTETLEVLDKNVSFLGSKLSSLTEDRKAVYYQLQKQQRIYEMNQIKMMQELNSIEDEIDNFDQCRIKASMIFPPTKIIMGPVSYIVNTTEVNCNVYTSEGEIKIGTK